MSLVLECDDGKVLHVWTTSAGDAWVCAAADHGPLCRVCAPVSKRVADAITELASREQDLAAALSDFASLVPPGRWKNVYPASERTLGDLQKRERAKRERASAPS